MRHACLPAGRSARQRPPPSPHRRPRQGAPVKQKRTKQQSVAARVWKSSYYRRRQRTMPNARTRRGSGTRAPYPPDAHRRRVTTMAGHAGAQTETWGGASCAYKHTNMRLRKAAGRRWPPAPPPAPLSTPPAPPAPAREPPALRGIRARHHSPPPTRPQFCQGPRKGRPGRAAAHAAAPHTREPAQ